MPDCPKKTADERKQARWENVSGKALKDWATRLMATGLTRAQAREQILAEIASKAEQAHVKRRSMLCAFGFHSDAFRVPGPGLGIVHVCSRCGVEMPEEMSDLN
jgi:hypothetical protein